MYCFLPVQTFGGSVTRRACSGRLRPSCVSNLTKSHTVIRAINSGSPDISTRTDPFRRVVSAIRRVAYLSAAGLILLNQVNAQGIPSIGVNPQKVSANRVERFADQYGKLPLSFEPNRGQADHNVRFLSRGSAYGIYVTDQGPIIALPRSTACEELASSRKARFGHSPEIIGLVTPGRSGPCGSVANENQIDAVAMQLINPNRTARPVALSQLPGVANYFLGDNPALWHANIPTYSRVQYSSIYKGIDLVYYGNQHH